VSTENFNKTQLDPYSQAKMDEYPQIEYIAEAARQARRQAGNRPLSTAGDESRPRDDRYLFNQI